MKKCFSTVIFVGFGIALVVFGARVIYDSLTGGRGRWYYLLPPAIAYISLCINEAKSRK